MRRSQRCCYVNVVAVFSCVLPWHGPAAIAVEGWTSFLVRLTPATEKIYTELEKPTQVDFIETPLNQAIEFLAAFHDIAIVIDRKALKEVSIDPKDTAVTRTLKRVSLESALNLILAEHDLRAIVKDEVLQVTTREVADGHIETRVYLVADLLEGDETADDLAVGLSDALLGTTRRSSRTGAGIGAYKQLLMVRGNHDLQRQAGHTIRAIYEALEAASKRKPLPRDFKGA
jgi:hypothetical protein